MLRIYGQLSVFGTKAVVEQLASAKAIPGATTMQIGLKRRVPDVDAWCYESPRYRFHLETIDAEVRDFVLAYAQIGPVIEQCGDGVRFAFFTLTPVDQSYEEEFACALNSETVRAIADIGIGIQIAPAAVMPDAPFWGDKPGRSADIQRSELGPG